MSCDDNDDVKWVLLDYLTIVSSFKSASGARYTSMFHPRSWLGQIELVIIPLLILLLLLKCGPHPSQHNKHTHNDRFSAFTTGCDSGEKMRREIGNIKIILRTLFIRIGVIF